MFKVLQIDNTFIIVLLIKTSISVTATIDAQSMIMAKNDLGP